MKSTRLQHQRRSRLLFCVEQPGSMLITYRQSIHRTTTTSKALQTHSLRSPSHLPSTPISTTMFLRPSRQKSITFLKNLALLLCIADRMSTWNLLKQQLTARTFLLLHRFPDTRSLTLCCLTSTTMPLVLRQTALSHTCTMNRPSQGTLQAFRRSPVCQPHLLTSAVLHHYLLLFFTSPQSSLNTISGMFVVSVLRLTPPITHFALLSATCNPALRPSIMSYKAWRLRNWPMTCLV